MSATIQPLSPTQRMYPTVGIVGVGLIGGSLGLALQHHHLATQVLGSGRSAANMAEAIKIGAITQIATLSEIAEQAQLIVLCVPVAQTKAVLEQIQPQLRPETIIIDVGSTKSDVIAIAKEVLGEQIGQFIPCHPIAGGAQHGATAARVDLFEQRQFIICPLLENAPQAIQTVEKMWQQLGSTVFQMSALVHDHIFAAVSHLPHLLSYALMLQVANSEDAQAKFAHAGAGFRDFTRIAGSSPEMWRDITFANSEAILEQLDDYILILQHFKKLIQDGNSNQLEKLLNIASQSRNNWKG
ncbi:prephenate dehydrogenase [Polynucleobacter kasalickyi]|uniref:prephenate dehydrogenase n=1 Tax=Polynucleobacter kasalickyi TaxID=1938817 RepID=A0A1W1YB10_9BURK|nr:prephenate dehydrogenase/arogenate dehydrogenase family protein [Polynucleobacter kasalickyi]SMC33346.1 prephenate dehydrogenase [Polynucleobacter kasalickyi]